MRDQTQSTCHVIHLVGADVWYCNLCYQRIHLRAYVCFFADPMAFDGGPRVMSWNVGDCCWGRVKPVLEAQQALEALEA
jgi:hypothetical protein